MFFFPFGTMHVFDGQTEEQTDFDSKTVCMHLQSINQSIDQFISRHSTEARATVRLCQIKGKCLKTDLLNVLTDGAVAR